MSRKVAFITGASRGIGAEAAVALARIGFDVAITARTLAEGESHDHVGKVAPLPGSLEATAAAIEAAGGRALCLRGDILDGEGTAAAARRAREHFGRIDLLFNNAVYQGIGNLSALLETSRDQIAAIYQANVFTPLALVQEILPGMLERGGGTILNMVSFAAFHNPPAPADRGGWSFAYSSSKAASARMAGSIRAEHRNCGVRVFNLEPGTVITEVIKAAGIHDELVKRFKTVSAASVAAVVAWLAENEPRPEWGPDDVLHAPAIAKQLDLLKVPSFLAD